MSHRVLDITDRAYDPRVPHPHGYAPAIRIPTDDPAAALQFCQRLAVLMEAATDADSLLADQFGTVTGGLALHDREPPRPDISVVIPVFNEEDNLSSLLARL